MEDNKKTFAEEVIRELQVQRWMKQLSQQEIANRMGTTKSAVSRLEKGGQNISLDTVARYGYALGLQPKFSLAVPEDIGLYGAETNYCLRLFDEDLVKFTMKDGPDAQVHIEWYDEKKMHLMPIGLELTDEGLLKWLSRRTIPKNREFVEEILGAYHLTANDTKAILDLCKGLSLNDSYWIVPEGFQQTFEECNLYEHDFMEILSVIAYTGAPYSLKQYSSSPEFTTNGMLRKTWRNKGEDGIWLYKGGTEGFANAGNEPFSEVLAYQIARQMELNAVPYELENWKGILASKCKLFTNKYFSYVPIGQVVKDDGIRACLAYYRELGPAFYDQLCSMLVFDALIYNEDRHFGNFGLLRDSRTGEFAAPAPIFDNGIGLFCYGTKSDFDDIQSYAAKRTPPYKLMTFEDVARLAIGPLQKEQLRRMINFRFEDTDPVCLPRWRIRGIEEQLRRRVYELLHL